jgi:FixJ family two-component response regulator
VVYHDSAIDKALQQEHLHRHFDCITIVPMHARHEIVYLIDDDARLREALRALLEAHGLSVLTFDSAQSYLEHTRSDAAACLILDLELPGTNGLELQQQLRAERGPPIVFLSGRGDIPKTVRAMKAGAVEFLTKPVLPETLLAAVVTALSIDTEARKHRGEMDGLHERLASLTPREREVLPLVISGLRNKQGAAALGITEFTFQVHRGQIMRKMQAKSLAELVRIGVTLGIA